MTNARKSAAGITAPARRASPATPPERASAANLSGPARPSASADPAATPPRKSAAGIKISRRPIQAQTPPSSRSPAARRRATFDGLRALRDSLATKANRNEQATALIQACVSSDIRSRGEIIGALIHLGFRPGHAAATLDRGARSGETAALWKKGADGLYNLTA